MDEWRTAAALALGRTAWASARPVQERVQALGWLPLAGALVGSLASAVAAVVAPVSSHAAALCGAAVLAVALGPRPGRPLALLVAVVEMLALLATPPGARSIALVLAPMLARWALVVQCYGGMATPTADGLATLAGRARFREFGIASVTALGACLVLLDAVGLAVAGVAALVTTSVRVLAYRRHGGIDDGALNATSALVETSALVMLASIGRLLAAGAS